MNLDRRTIWLACLAGLLLTAGCGGFQASRSVSPATFLIPGFIQNDIKTDHIKTDNIETDTINTDLSPALPRSPVPSAESIKLVAQAN